MRLLAFALVMLAALPAVALADTDSSAAFALDLREPRGPSAPLSSVFSIDLGAGSSDGSGQFAVDLRSATGLELSYIASPQEAGVPFQVTLTARDSSGNVVPQSGTIWLDAGFAGIDPTRVWLQNGSADLELTLDTPGDDVLIRADGAGLVGQSNAFDVDGGNCSAGLVRFRAVDAGGSPVGNATVHMSSGSSCTTDAATGACSIQPLASGSFTAWAVGPGGAISASVPAPLTCNPQVVTLTLPPADCNPTGLTPVLLVPGIMGSSTAAGWVYPRLPREAPTESDWPQWDRDDEGGLLDPGNDFSVPPSQVGWRSLVDAFQSVDANFTIGCTLFPTPYDWRMDVADAADAYLIPMIEHAKDVSGMAKVNIVAHSMGGLVTRSYINGLTDPPMPQSADIDHFIMVGTPNHGAAIAYYLWEGGDPVLSDEMSVGLSGSTVAWLLQFYSMTAEWLYETHFDDRIDFSDYEEAPYFYRRRMLNLIRFDGGIGHVPSIRQLLPTSDDLYLNGNPPRSAATFPNTMLDGLNTDLSRLGDWWSTDPNQVKTRIYASNDQDTLSQIAVGVTQPDSDFYPDGSPRTFADTGEWVVGAADGDGTVQATSATLPGVTVQLRAAGEHSGLIGELASEIVFDITGTFPQRRSQPGRTATSVLTVSVSGRPQPLLTAPGGLASGVDPVTSGLREEIAGARVELKARNAAVIVTNPAAGSYTVTLSGAYAEDCVVMLEYGDAQVMKSLAHRAYFDGTSFTFAFSLDPASPERLTVQLEPPPPSALVASFNGGFTDLAWAPSEDPQVTGYALYSRTEGGASLRPLATTAGTSFATSDPWATDEATPTRLYAVASRYADGSESFLSSTVRNDDRDHDGITDADEARRGTLVDIPDTDDDGLNDGEEDYYGTDPFLADSDGDGYGDSEEVDGGSDPLDPASLPAAVFTDGFEGGTTFGWSQSVGMAAKRNR